MRERVGHVDPGAPMSALSNAGLRSKCETFPPAKLAPNPRHRPSDRDRRCRLEGEADGIQMMSGVCDVCRTGPAPVRFRRADQATWLASVVSCFDRTLLPIRFRASASRLLAPECCRPILGHHPRDPLSASPPGLRQAKRWGRSHSAAVSSKVAKRDTGNEHMPSGKYVCTSELACKRTRRDCAGSGKS